MHFLQPILPVHLHCTSLFFHSIEITCQRVLLAQLKVKWRVREKSSILAKNTISKPSKVLFGLAVTYCRAEKFNHFFLSRKFLVYKKFFVLTPNLSIVGCIPRCTPSGVFVVAKLCGVCGFFILFAFSSLFWIISSVMHRRISPNFTYVSRKNIISFIKRTRIEIELLLCWWWHFSLDIHIQFFCLFFVSVAHWTNTQISSCVKYMIFLLNFIFWLFGGLLIGIGFYAFYEKWQSTGWVRVETIYDIVLNISLVMVISGAVVFVVSFAGCLGALRENTCLLKFYSMCLLLVFLLEMAVAIVGFVFPHNMNSFLEDSFTDKIIHTYRDDPDLQNFIDFAQQEFKCCGLSNAGESNDIFKMWTLSKCGFIRKVTWTGVKMSTSIAHRRVSNAVASHTAAVLMHLTYLPGWWTSCAAMACSKNQLRRPAKRSGQTAASKSFACGPNEIYTQLLALLSVPHSVNCLWSFWPKRWKDKSICRKAAGHREHMAGMVVIECNKDSTAIWKKIRKTRIKLSKKYRPSNQIHSIIEYTIDEH